MRIAYLRHGRALPRASLLPLLLATVFALAACGGGSAGGSPGFGLTSRTPVGGLGFPTGLAQPTALTPVQAFPDLRFDRPLFLTHAGDGSGRLFVLEQGGRVRVFANDPAVSSAGTFLDISGLVSTANNEEGLLGLAFHPEYATNGRLYVYYSAAAPRRSVLARYTVSPTDPDRADPASAEVLLEVPQPFGNHNGGCLAFGPDGKLYVALGDGGSADDPQNNAQDPGTLLGSILRLNDDGSIPADNPFVGEAGARGEIWAYGLRNPWRFSFDRSTGDLWCGDVGQNAFEEIDLVVRGGNYGWRVYEGNDSHINPAGLPPSAFEAPVITYPHSLGRSVTGGYVYRGTALRTLQGTYLYADFVFGRVWALVWDGANVVSNTEIARITNPSSFGEDADGELYVCSFDGAIYRFEESGGTPDDIPQLLSDTGLFADTAALRPSPGLIEYDVNAPLWSDGARKRRWIALPGTSRIGFAEEGPWDFPVGTVTVKHFELDLAGGTTRRLETRVMVHAQAGWLGFTYRWNDAQDDAVLLEGSASDEFEVADPSAPGGTRTQTWTWPDRADCMVCHTAAYGRVLGIRTHQLNRDFVYPARTDNQLRAWNHIGLFTTDIGEAARYPALADPSDATAPADARARSYLEANCAICHLPGGPTPANMDLRVETPLASMKVLDEPASNPGDDPGALRVVPGDHEASVLWRRVVALDEGRMPPIGSRVVDPLARDLLALWIDALP